MDERTGPCAADGSLRRGGRTRRPLGALGGPRFDHALANAWLLAHPVLAGRSALLLDARCRIRLLDASRRAVAAELAGSGRDVCVIERHAAIGQETSSRNSEVIHSGIYYPPGSLKARLSSNALTPPALPKTI